jgi:hypothetical protein
MEARLCFHDIAVSKPAASARRIPVSATKATGETRDEIARHLPTVLSVETLTVLQAAIGRYSGGPITNPTAAYQSAAARISASVIPAATSDMIS